jgi:hypothetical protein
VPAGVTRSFQVCAYSIDPYRESRACNATPNLSDNGGAGNLLSEDNGGTASDNEVSEHWPQVPLVGCSFSGASATERLARATSCPDSRCGSESCPLQGETPKSNPGKKVALVISAQFIIFDFKDAPFVYVSRRQMAVGN